MPKILPKSDRVQILTSDNKVEDFEEKLRQLKLNAYSDVNKYRDELVAKGITLCATCAINKINAELDRIREHWNSFLQRNIAYPPKMELNIDFDEYKDIMTLKNSVPRSEKRIVNTENGATEARIPVLYYENWQCPHGHGLTMIMEVDAWKQREKARTGRRNDSENDVGADVEDLGKRKGRK